jgi:type IV pilus assembly protein PilN
MIKVNLLSTIPGEAPPKDWIPKEQRSALAGLGMLLATAIAVGGYWWYLSSDRAGIETKIAAAEAELNRLKEAATLVDRATARKAELAERVSLIERLRAGKNGPVSLLETVSLSTTDGLWLTEIKQAGASVQIEGRSMSLSAVTDFAEQLQNSGLFKRPVEILSTTSEVIDLHDVVKFALKAEAAPPPAAPAAPTAVTSSPSITSVAPTRGATPVAPPPAPMTGGSGE